MAIKRTPKTPGSAGPGMPVMPQMKGKKLKKLKKPKKPLPRFMLVVLTALVFILLIGGAGACLYFNVSGIADKAAVILLPKYRTVDAGLAKREAALKAGEDKLKADKAKVAADLDDVAKKTADLTEREKKLQADRKAFEDSKTATPAPNASVRPTVTQNSASAVNIYKNLDAEDAAAMLVNAPTLREAADILAQLPTDKAAEIIAAIKAIDAEKAYNLTKLIGQ